MNNQIFRKESLDRISSPEQLNDYIKVSNPSVWLIIIALLILVGSFSTWAFNGNITSEVSATGLFQSSTDKNTVDSVIYYADVSYVGKLSEGMPVRIYEKDKKSNNSFYLNGKISSIAKSAVKQEDILKSYSSEYIADAIMDAAYGVKVEITINKNANGSYEWANGEKSDESFISADKLCSLEIITESITPIEFLIHQSK